MVKLTATLSKPRLQKIKSKAWENGLRKLWKEFSKKVSYAWDNGLRNFWKQFSKKVSYAWENGLRKFRKILFQNVRQYK